MKVVYFGTPQFAATLLENLLENKVNVVAVITRPDRPKGRSGHPIPTAVKEVALSQNPPIPVFQPEVVSAPEFAPTLAAYEADLFIVVAYGEILKQHLLDMPKLACVNVHASILPKYRGAAPIQRSIIEGEKETGITLIHMAKKMDAGDIISVTSVPIGEDTTYGELERSLCQASLAPLLNLIRIYEKGEIPERHAQDHSQATLAPKIELEECEIDWTKSAVEIHNLVRGVNPEPGAWCFVTFKSEKKRLKINGTIVHPEQSAPPGTIISSDRHRLIVGCGSGALEIIELQLEGKRKMTAGDFIRGISITQLSFN